VRSEDRYVAVQVVIVGYRGSEFKYLSGVIFDVVAVNETARSR
jgi:hypothetical protein